MNNRKHDLKVLIIDAGTGFYRMQRYRYDMHKGIHEMLREFPS